MSKKKATKKLESFAKYQAKMQGLKIMYLKRIYRSNPASKDLLYSAPPEPVTHRLAMRRHSTKQRINSTYQWTQGRRLQYIPSLYSCGMLAIDLQISRATRAAWEEANNAIAKLKLSLAEDYVAAMLTEHMMLLAEERALTKNKISS